MPTLQNLKLNSNYNSQTIENDNQEGIDSENENLPPKSQSKPKPKLKAKLKNVSVNNSQQSENLKQLQTEIKTINHTTFDQIINNENLKINNYNKINEFNNNDNIAGNKNEQNKINAKNDNQNNHKFINNNKLNTTNDISEKKMEYEQKQNDNINISCIPNSPMDLPSLYDLEMERCKQQITKQKMSFDNNNNNQSPTNDENSNQLSLLPSQNFYNTVQWYEFISTMVGRE